MVRALFIFIFSLFLTSSLYSQFYFNRVYDTQNLQNGFISSIELSNKLIFGTGTSWYSFGPNVDYLSNILVNDSGTVVWSKLDLGRTDGGLVAGFCVIESNSKILITGPIADISEGGSDIFLYAISFQGDSLWYQNLDAGFSDESRNILEDKDNGFLVLGYYYLADFDSSRIIIIKTDSSGNKLWQREYGQPRSYNFAYECAKSYDGGYILFGSRNDNNNQNSNFLLMKLDSVFNEEWAKSYDGGFLEVPGVHSSLVVTNDGYIMVGQQEYFASSSGTNRTKGYIVKTDKNGNKTWDKLVGYPYRDVGYRGIVASGINKFMLLGVVAEDTGWNGMARAVLAKMDTAGNIFWQREYNHYNASDSDHVYPSQIVQLLNGDFLISGYVLYPYPTSHHNDAWLMKTDSCGYTEGDVSVAQIQADSIINKTVYLHNTSPEYCSWQWYFGDGDSSSVRHPTHTYSDSGRYIITLITKAGNDRDTAYLQVEIDTSIVNSQQSIVKPQMQLYPNPAKDYIILSGYIPESSGKAMLELYDMQGKLVERQMLETGPVNRSIGTRNLATGVYAYRVYTNTETIKTGRVYVE